MKTARVRNLKLKGIIIFIFAIIIVVGWRWVTDKRISQVSSKTAGWNIYRNNDFGIEIKYPQDWKFEPHDIPYSEDDFGFHLASTSKSIPEQIIITVSCFRGRTAEYVFKNCCESGYQTEKIGENEFCVNGPVKFEGYQEWYYTIGDKDLLIEFNFGVGRRSGNPEHPEDDYPSEESFSKEFSDFKMILSTFRFTE